MNASAIHVLYLIKSDGTVVIPNTSENSLYDIRGTFETGERMLINTQTISAGGTQYRNVIRGGTRIEPILYTQFGSSPNATWDTTMSFEDIVLTASGSILGSLLSILLISSTMAFLVDSVSGSKIASQIIVPNSGFITRSPFLVLN
jgi:hypothetical protein